MLTYRDFHSFSCNQKVSGPLAIYTPKYQRAQEICPVYEEGMFCLYPIRKDPGGGLLLSTRSCGPAILPEQAETLFKEGILRLPSGVLQICGEITARRIIETNEVMGRHLYRFDLIEEVEDFLIDEVFNESLTPEEVWEFLNSCKPCDIWDVHAALAEVHENIDDAEISEALRRALRLKMESLA